MQDIGSFCVSQGPQNPQRTLDSPCRAPTAGELAFALAARESGFCKGLTTLSEHKVTIAHFPKFRVAKGNWRVLLTPVKALVMEPRCAGFRGPCFSLILRSSISCPFPLLCNEEEGEGLEGLGRVV